ncbi:MAG: shikimate dehydrogenase [Gammaproteobacteria bacterium]|nr:shikimate dehydrogenase [Gammaproteobacteria bacterium]HBF09320.1 shikimate dehydrogenase [Gammaproteobacteria bacterium]
MFDSKLYKLGVIGNPIKHSRSPEIHRLFAIEEGLHVEYDRYYAEESEFETCVQRFFHNGGTGLNITLPFKSKALALAHELSARAQLVGAVNTLKFADGQIFGDTTDGQGLVSDLERLGWADSLGKNILLIGAGGAMRSVLPDLLGFNPQTLTLLNRTESKAIDLIKEVEAWREQLGFTTKLSAGALDSSIDSQPDIIISGASQFQALPGCKDLASAYCYDLNYGSRADQYLSWAQALGAKPENCSDGLGMLVGQAAVSFGIWTEKKPDIGVVMSLLKDSNPWLEDWWQPPFHLVDVSQINDAVVTRLHEKEEQFQQRMQDIEAGKVPLTWDSFVRCYEELNDQLSRVWSVLSHLNSVRSNEELREAYNRLQLELSEHYTKEMQNPLFKSLIEKLTATRAAERFSDAQKKWCANKLLDFKLSGADLVLSDQEEFAALEKDLAQLSTQFSDAVLDATEAWFLDISDLELKGMPVSSIDAAREEYRKAHDSKDEHMCRLTLKAPSYLAVMRFCANREVREQVYEAYATRASDKGPQAGRFDTTQFIEAILVKRSKQSSLLGYSNFAEYSLATKMADTPQQVIDFLANLAKLSKPQAERERQELESFAKNELGFSSLEAWDYAYIGEKLKEKQFDLDSEKVREYFPTTQVLDGLFEVIHKLFGVSCEIDRSVPTYHEDAQFVNLKNEGEIVGGLYIDLYARDRKRGGAWMDECRQRHITREGTVLPPIAYLVCNSSPATESMPSLMTHDEVVTLFHEAGHCLHHLLSNVDVAELSGIQGVEWDAVEVPSQLMEGWCYRPEVIPMLSKHYSTGQALPQEDLDKIIDAKNFQSALGMMKQLEYALFDMSLHQSKCNQESDAPNFISVLDKVRDDVGVLPVPSWHRFPNAFSHIFAGGYAAGYYGYKWAEVYAADVFSEFKRAGVFNLTLGQSLKDEWLSQGGVRATKDNFTAFMGRELQLKSLLEDVGIQD